MAPNTEVTVRKFALLFCSLFVLASIVQAGTIIYDSTLQASDGSDPITAEFNPIFDSFSTGTNSGALTRLQLLLEADPASAGYLTVGLYADSGILPGALITTLGTVNDFAIISNPTLIDVALGANPVLAAGTRYWIGLLGTGSTASWNWTTDTSGIGVNGEYFSHGGLVFPNNPDGGYQMEVEIGAGVPEPATFGMAGAMLAGLFAFLRRRP